MAVHTFHFQNYFMVSLYLISILNQLPVFQLPHILNVQDEAGSMICLITLFQANVLSATSIHFWSTGVPDS
jgi:hypothetical protein